MNADNADRTSVMYFLSDAHLSGTVCSDHSDDAPPGKTKVDPVVQQSVALRLAKVLKMVMVHINGYTSYDVTKTSVK